MSSVNPFGIFASVISSNHNHGIARLRSIVTSDEQAARIVSLAVATICMHTGEDAAEVEAYIVDGASRCYVRTRQAVKLVWAALSAVESAYSTRGASAGAGEGFESAAPITDCRAAGDVAEACLMAA